MAHFNYYPEEYTGNERYFRITRPSDSKVWKDDTGLVDADTVPDTNTQAETSVALDWNAGLRGYEVNIPAALERGEYDILIFNAAKDSADASDPVEAGFGFRWSGQYIYAPAEKLVDRVG